MTRPSLLLLVLAALLPVRADEEPPPFFPLEIGLTWSYGLEITRQGESQGIQYSARVTRREEVSGLPCAVVESRSGERLLEATWWAWEGKKLVHPRRQSGRGAVQELRRAGADGPRVLVDLAALDDPEAPRRWEWQAADGSARGVIELVGRERLTLPNLGELDCVLLVERSELRAGERKATQERKIWLAAGLGLVQERSKIAVEGGETTETVAVLERPPERS